MSDRRGGAPRDPRRAGVTLVEVLVALVFLSLVASAVVRLLGTASREMDGAELGLRAALFLAESADLPSGGGPSERSAGPGVLQMEREGGTLRVRYLPPGGDAGLPSDAAPVRGFRAPRSWSIGGDR